RNSVATAVVIGVGLLVGFRPSADVGAWIGVVGLLALYILALTYLFAAIGLAAASPEAATGYGIVLLFLPYLSSGYVPVESLPDWLQPVAAHQPVPPLLDTPRALLTGQSLDGQQWWAIGWCVLILAVAALWGAWLYRRKAGRR